MKIRLADRMEGYNEGVFQVLDAMLKDRRARGEEVFNFSVGTPDFEVAPYIRQAVLEAAADPENYKYSLGDSPELLAAVRDRFRDRYSVSLKDEMITGVYGTQEGIAHVAFPLCNPGDIVLVPNPGYPVFSMGPAMAGARIETYELKEEKDYVLDFSDISDDLADRARMIIVSYPLNPVCATAPRGFYEELVRWAKTHEVIVVHDNAYSDIVFDGGQGISFLSIPGAVDVGVEFYSLSKSFNLTGARVSFLAGNPEIVKAVRRFRSQIDYGLFTVVQKAAIAALRYGDEDVKKQCAEYQKRRDALCGGFRSIGWDFPDSKGSMFAWACIPGGRTSSVDFVKELFEKTGVLCTPGVSFGTLGEGHVRFALTHGCDEIRRAVEAIGRSGIL